MEQVQPLLESLKVAPQPARVEGERAPRRLARLLVATLALHVVLGAALVALGLSVREHLQQLDVHLGQQAATAEKQALQLATLGDQGKETRAELTELRRAVSSHAREEALFLKMLILKPDLDPALARRISRTVQNECLLFGQDPNLVLAIMAVESDFNPKATSLQGAVGLMQVMPHWKKVLGLQSELTEPEVSIHSGIQILGFYQQMYRDLDTALTAYNRGPGQVDGALMRGTSPANGYGARVIATWERLKELDATSRP
jgi:Transglycosylase SLT domain